MTREEALNVIWMRCQHNDETYEAYCVLKHEQQPCEDAISRQKMLEGLANIAKAKARSDAQKALMGRIMFFTEKLPPINPQNPCEPVRNPDQLDCISRQAVIDAINTDWHEDLSQLTDAIKALPPVTSQQKMGHWIGDGNYICSCCKCDPLDFLEPEGLDGGSYMDTPMKYCPNCGAKMAESEE